MHPNYDTHSQWPGAAGVTPEVVATVRATWPGWFTPIAPVPMDDTDDFALVDQPAPGDDEPLVAVDHQRITCTASYFAVGLDHAVPATLVRSGTATLLYGVADRLPEPFGLAVFDAWRPLALQTLLYDTVDGANIGYLSVPSTDVRTPPPHVTGGCVDVTLSFDGQPLSLGTVFDDFTELAHPHTLEDPGVAASLGTDGPVARDLRRMLFNVMTDAGFVVYPMEWWHYEYGTRRWSFHTGQPPRYSAASPSATTAD